MRSDRPPGRAGPALAVARLLGPAVRTLDRLLVRLYGLESASGRGPECGEDGLRIRVRTLERRLALRDTQLAPGAPYLEIHLCNERTAEAVTREGAARWATHLLVRYRRSCRTLAERLLEDPALATVEAVGGVTSIFGGAGGHGGAGRLPAHLGFEVLPHRQRWGALGRFFERLYAWSLLAAYTPGSLEGRRITELSFVEVWMTRRDFLEKFGPGA